MDMYSILNTRTGHVKLYHPVPGNALKSMMLMLEDCSKQTDKPVRIVLEKPINLGLKRARSVITAKVEKGVTLSDDMTKAELKDIIEKYDLGVKHTQMGRDKMLAAVIVALGEEDINVVRTQKDGEESIPLAGTVLIVTSTNINDTGIKLSQAIQKRISFVVQDYYIVTCAFISKAGYEKGVCDLPTSKTGF